MVKFTETHEWIRKDGSMAKVGLTIHAQKELGEVVFVELPEVGKELKANEEACVIESTKAAADIYAPVTGKVTKTNEKVVEDPSLINRSPEEEGWLFEMEIAQEEEYEDLLDPFEYESLID